MKYNWFNSCLLVLNSKREREREREGEREREKEGDIKAEEFLPDDNFLQFGLMSQ